MKFYFDEDSAKHRLVSALRTHAIDVLTTLDAGMSARDDLAQLTMAASQDRVLVSANVCDFAALHREWLEQGQSHSGILIIPQQRYSTGEIVRRFVRLATARVDWKNGLYYLSKLLNLCQSSQRLHRAAEHFVNKQTCS